MIEHLAFVQSPPQQQGHARELEQELSRLRQEGEAYRDDLKQQLEGAKQAAMQARHEAGQANAQATHEHSLVQQLQEDKRRMADIVDSWKRQGHEQQVWPQCRLDCKVLPSHELKPCAISWWRCGNHGVFLECLQAQCTSA